LTAGPEGGAGDAGGGARDAGGGARDAGGGTRYAITRLGGDPPSPYEERFGFSRVLRLGALVFVGGTTSIDEDGVVQGETPYEQTVVVLEKLGHELGRAGASLADVVQTRAYLTDISRADEVGRAHGEALAEVRPLLTMVEVSALIDPRMLVEIEAVAVVGAR
jgi:enamine deaminase RidA (YjgF/YER057c/UK114 family)